MKRNHLLLAAIAIFAITTTFYACKKTDNTPPTITLSGSNPMSISLNSSPSDPGASATDNKGNSVTPTSNWSLGSNPNQNMTGSYTIIYTAKDGNGNSSTAQRTVTVKNDAEVFAGAYN